MIPKNTIDEIFETVKIEEVISDFITLKKRGVNLLGLCPFTMKKLHHLQYLQQKGYISVLGVGRGGIVSAF